jgi:hypothetical protein
MKKILLLASLALTTGAFAQGSDVKLALARETISAMHADKMLDAMANQMTQMVGKMIPLPPDTTPEKRQKIEEIQAKALSLSVESISSMVAKMDEVYASVYTEAKLKAMKAFFTSPEGQSMIAKQSQVMAQTMPLVQQMQRDLMPKIKQLVDEARSASQAAPPPAPEAKAPAAPAAGK